jgi:hypothetical protein
MLSANLLSAGYLLYWHSIDALQTPDGFYFQYSTQQATYLADSLVSSRMAAARGLLTVKDADAANPVRLVRPTSDGTVGSQGAIQLPELVIEIVGFSPGVLVELGSRIRRRQVLCAIYGWVRNRAEMQWMTRQLREWFDCCLIVPIYDHDAGTQALIGQAEIIAADAGSMVVGQGAEAETFEVLLSMRLEFEA